MYVFGVFAGEKRQSFFVRDPRFAVHSTLEFQRNTRHSAVFKVLLEAFGPFPFMVGRRTV